MPFLDIMFRVVFPNSDKVFSAWCLARDGVKLKEIFNKIYFLFWKTPVTSSALFSLRKPEACASLKTTAFRFSGASVKHSPDLTKRLS